MSNGPPPRSPGAPPMPPPRRADASYEQTPNPFTGSAPLAPAPTPEPSQVNPFLAGSPTPSPASQVEQAPRVIPPGAGAPLRVQPGATSPNVRDAHAEFRKGGWKKPMVFFVLAAAIVGGLFFGLPEQQPEKPSPFADSDAGPVTVIGASVSPEVIPDPDRPSLQNPNPERQRPRTQEPPSASATPTDRSDSFGDAFKSSAR